MNKITTSKPGQALLQQHSTDDQLLTESSPIQGILVPLDLPEFKIVSQFLHLDGSIEVQVIARTDRAACPTCKKICRKVHDTRGRVKRDLSLREHPVHLVLAKRRFRCLTCRKTFTETDGICGRYKRTTKRFRDHLGQQAETRPIAHIAQEMEVGSRFTQECFEASMQERIAEGGHPLEENAPIATPRFLGIDEFVRRKGHHYDTILCDLVKRTVLEISEGRKMEEVQRLLERLDSPDAVEAVSMDMSASFRPAVHLCLPKAHIVVDHFHVVQHVMKGFKKIVSSWAHKKEGKPLLQGKQCLFLSAQEDLTKKQAQDRATRGKALPLLEKAWRFADFAGKSCMNFEAVSPGRMETHNQPRRKREA
ncbi:MAG: ISL3 family transposase [Chloroflexota bacterium]|nr:ISL3 family transposase [Chloroflexota bacterium]